MGLSLHPVAPANGWRWIARGFGAWRRRPLGFIGLFVSFMFGALLLASLIPFVGGLAALALTPLLSLGFMIATREALAGRPVTVRALIEAARGPDRAQRRAQWQLCAGYAAAAATAFWLADWLDGGALGEFMRLLSDADPRQPSVELRMAMADPRLSWGLLARGVLLSAISAPWWYAPALVHFGGQGPVQALFSSTLALWRARGAFLVFGLSWLGLLLLTVPVATLLVTLLGSPRLIGMLTLPAGLILSSVFYITLWFGYGDSFGTPEPAPPAA